MIRHAREHNDHPDSGAGFSDRLANFMADKVGTMATFYVLVAWQLLWIVVASAGIWLFKHDQYPFAFLLFLSNLIQLWYLPVLQVTSNKLAARQQISEDVDHQNLLSLAALLQKNTELTTAVQALTEEVHAQVCTPRPLK